MKSDVHNLGGNSSKKEQIVNGDNRITNNDNRVNNTDRIDEDQPVVPVKEKKKPSKMVLNKKSTNKKVKGKAINRPG